MTGGKPYVNIEDENRSSVRVDLSRDIGEPLRAVVRYTFYANELGASSGIYRRHTLLLSLAFVASGSVRASRSPREAEERVGREGLPGRTPPHIRTQNAKKKRRAEKKDLLRQRAGRQLPAHLPPPHACCCRLAFTLEK